MMKPQLSCRSSPCWTIMTIIVFLSTLSLEMTTAEKMRLAECPKDGVIGTYNNNGKKCVRDKVVMNRDRAGLICPADMEYKRGSCRQAKESNSEEKLPSKKPTCPDGFQLGFASPQKNSSDDDNKKTNSPPKTKICLGICLEGYLTKNSKCILPRDVLSNHYMSCPIEGDHRLDVYCTSLEVECHLSNLETLPSTAPIFRYRDFDGICERPKQVIALEYTIAPRNATECSNPNDKMLYTPTVRVCQKRCPSSVYTAKKGKCVLPKCLVKPEDMIGAAIHCPEGAYSQTSLSLH